MQTSETIAVLVTALIEAQKAFKPLKRTATAGGGGKYTYKYAPLDELIDATQGALGTQGLTVIQVPTLTSESYVLELLKEKQVFFAPGSAFGQNGERYVRVSICIDTTDIDQYL